jgi:hypothetical protein
VVQWVYWQAHWVWAYQWQKQEYTPEDRAFLTYKVGVTVFSVPVCNGNDDSVAHFARLDMHSATRYHECGCTATACMQSTNMHAVIQAKCRCRRSSGHSPFGRGCQRLSGMS